MYCGEVRFNICKVLVLCISLYFVRIFQNACHDVRM